MPYIGAQEDGKAVFHAWQVRGGRQTRLVTGWPSLAIPSKRRALLCRCRLLMSERFISLESGCRQPTLDAHRHQHTPDRSL